MPRTRQDSRLPGLLLGLASLVASGCGPSEIDLDINVMGLPTNAAAVRISASINGLSGPQNMDLKPAPKRFVLKLPNDSMHQGEVLLDITVLGVGGCVAGTAQHRIPVNGAEATVVSNVSVPRNQLWPCPSPTGSTQRSAWGSAANDVYTVGDSGTIVHFDGTNWTVSFSPTPGITLRGVGGTSKNRVLAGGDSGALIRFDGLAWRAINGPSSLITITGVGSAPMTGRIAVISVDSATVGRIYISDDEGGSWTQETISAGIGYRAGVNFTANDGWAVGDNGRARRYVSGQPTMDLDVSDGLDNFAIWGSSASDVWVAGEQGRIAHRNGNNWDIVASPAGTVALRAMHGNGPNNILCVGDMGTVLRWNGTGWQKIQSGTTNNLYGVFMNSNGTAWIAGERKAADPYSILLHYDPN